MGPDDLPLAYKHNMKYASNTFHTFLQHEFHHMFSKANYLTEGRSRRLTKKVNNMV